MRFAHTASRVRDPRPRPALPRDLLRYGVSRFSAASPGASRCLSTDPGAAIWFSCLVRPNCGFCTNYVPVRGTSCGAFRFTWLALAQAATLYSGTVLG